LTSDFLMPNAWNLPLFIGDGRKTIYLFWGPILALDLNQKDPNH
jgi:hypothetical protein